MSPGFPSREVRGFRHFAYRMVARYTLVDYDRVMANAEDDAEYTIKLRGTYWVAALAGLEFLTKRVLDTDRTMSEEARLSAANILLARGHIVDQLVEQGMMVPEAADEVGAKAMLERARKITSK